MSILRLIQRLICRYFGYSCPANKVTLIKETDMGLVYNAFLPTVTDPDVVTRKLKFVVDGVTSVLTVDPKAGVFELPPVKDGASVELSVCDIDDAGNESGYNTPLKFTAIDTIVPAIPGLVAVKIVKEVPDEVAPAPVVEPVKVEASVVVKTVVDSKPPVEPEQLIDLPPPSE